MLPLTILKKGKIVAALALMTSFAACDNSFDLSNINKDMTIGQNLTVPIGTTDTLRLSRLIDETEELKEAEDGSYAIEMTSSVASTVSETEVIRITDLKSTPTNIEVNVPDLGSTPVDYRLNQHLADKIEVNSKQDVPEEIEKITYIYAESAVGELIFSLDFQNPATYEKISNLKIQDWTIDFPDGLVFAQGIEGMDYATNRLTVNSPLDKNGSLKMQLPILAFHDVPDIDKTDNTVTFIYHIDSKGTLTADCKGVTSADFDGLVFNSDFQVTDFEITKVKGVFDKEMDIATETISLGELPDLLTDENTTVNINTVAMKAEMENPVGMAFDVNLHLSALDANKKVINQQVNVPVTLKPAADFGAPTVTRLWITNNQALTVPEGYELVYVPELNKLIQKVPQYIDITPTVATKKDGEYFIELGHSYDTQIDYDVKLPFDFGENSRIVYTDSFDGLRSDLEDIAGRVNELQVSAEIINAVPLALKASITPYDFEGNDMSDLVEYTRQIELEPAGENAAAQPKEIIIKEKVKGVLKNLERIDLKIDGETRGATSVLKPSQFVLVKLSARIPQGININDDDF